MSRRLAGRKPRFTREQVETMRRHRQAGIGSDAIAAVFGTSGSVVRRYLRGECVHHRRECA
jgi:hypothetical protein